MAPGPNPLHAKADLGQFVGALQDADDIVLRHVDDFRDQQALPRHRFAGQRGLQPFVDDALVRGMLVDDDQTVVGLGDDLSQGRPAGGRIIASRDPENPLA